MNLPCEFDIDKLLDKYFEIKTHIKKERRRDYAVKLRFVKKQLNLQILDNNTFKKIDKWMELYYNKKLDFNSTIMSKIIGAKAIFTTLFNYNFECVHQTYSRNNNIPEDIVNLYIENANIKELIDKFNKYLDTTNLAYSTKKNVLYHLSHTFIPLKEYFINDNITRQIILDRIQYIENNSNNEINTKVQDYVNQLSSTALFSINTFNKLIQSEIISSIKDIKLFRAQEIHIKERNINILEKDYFSEKEIEDLNNTITDVREKLILTIFLSTGLRRGGLLNLKVGGVFDDTFNVLTIGKTIEKKYNKLRKFTIFLPLKQALENYKNSKIYGKIITNLDNSLFPQISENTTFKYDMKKPFGVNYFNKIISNIFNNANITGHHTHCHAFRKTLVVKLMNEGNSLDNIAKFIGHSSSFITAKHYWVPNQQDLLKNMNMQWMLGENNLKNLDQRTLSYLSNKSLQLEKLKIALTEGFMAKERLTHVLSLLSLEQLDKMNNMWTDESNKNVINNVGNTIADIIENIVTLSEISSFEIINSEC
jgi:integrase